MSIWENSDKLIIAHRGIPSIAPENTLASFACVIDHKIKAVELDVYNIENNLVVFHDDHLLRLTGVDSFIDDLSLSELRKLSIKGKEKIPLLSEVLNLFKDYPEIAINIELKGQNTASLVSQLIEEFALKGFNKTRFLISSFRHHELAVFKNLQPDIKIGALMVGIPLNYALFAKQLNAFSVHLSWDCVDKDFITNAHQLGLKVFVFTVNSRNIFERMMNLGIDGVFSDVPHQLSLLK